MEIHSILTNNESNASIRAPDSNSPICMMGQASTKDETTGDEADTLMETSNTIEGNSGNEGTINGKEKSPMCLINELCRYNSIKSRYELIDESGAPHSKTFSVLLKLGDKEEFRASAASIRKAQHSAASFALASTKYPQPPPKSERKVPRSSSQQTPTVELNVLAMKRREPVQYHVYEQPIRQNLLSNLMTSNQLSSATSDLHDFRNLYHQRYSLARGFRPEYFATVTVGSRQFTGKGITIQIARHSAAEEALKTLRQLPLPVVTSNTVPVAPDGSSPVLIEVDDDDSKSPVSMIYEAAMKRNYSVQFEFVSESGPSHMPCFVVKCTVGEYSAEGRGVRKKTAKRLAAALVLTELETREPISEISGQKSLVNDDDSLSLSLPEKEPDCSSKKRSVAKMKEKKKKSKDKVDDLTTMLQGVEISSQSDLNNTIIQSKTGTNTIEVTSRKDDPRIIKSSFALNPISRLIQLQMAKKEDQPKFELISEVDVEQRRKVFTVQCSINVPKNLRSINAQIANNRLSSFGFGPNKRIAKRNAAEEMLVILGYSSSSFSESANSSTTSTATTSLSSSSSSSTTSSSLSPILKTSNTNSIIEPTENCDHGAETTTQADSQIIIKPDPGKERRVKFMMDSIDLKENTQSLAERLENLTEMTQSDSSGKYGGQIAPGLLLVMKMNQSNNDNYSVCLNEKTDIEEM